MVTVRHRILIVLDGEHGMDTPDRELARGVAMVYCELRRLGAETIFVCDGGGFPMVAGHMRRFSADPVIASFLGDHVARSDIADALAIEQIVVDDFDVAAFFMIDAADFGAHSALMRAFLDQGKPVVMTNGAPLVHPGPGIIQSSPTDLGWIRQLLQ
jgi:hypothetical protein